MVCLECETLKNELNILHLKLDSKAEALLILSQELQKAKIELEELRLEKQQKQLKTMRKQSMDHTELLSMQLMESKQKLKEATEDITLLREQITTSRFIDFSSDDATEKRDLIRKLEETNNMLEQNQKDIRYLTDERDELMIEKDEMESKYNTLNNRLNKLLGKEGPCVDINAVMSDNDYLQERIKAIDEEKRMVLCDLHKYKGAVDKKRPKGILKLGQKRSDVLIVAQKEVQQLLSSIDPLSPANQGVQMLCDLHTLANSLLGSLNDKSVALSHLRKTNKLLATRIEDLEKKITEKTHGRTSISLSTDGAGDDDDAEVYDGFELLPVFQQQQQQQKQNNQQHQQQQQQQNNQQHQQQLHQHQPQHTQPQQQKQQQLGNQRQQQLPQQQQPQRQQQPQQKLQQQQQQPQRQPQQLQQQPNHQTTTTISTLNNIDKINSICKHLLLN